MARFILPKIGDTFTLVSPFELKLHNLIHYNELRRIEKYPSLGYPKGHFDRERDFDREISQISIDMRKAGLMVMMPGTAEELAEWNRRVHAAIHACEHFSEARKEYLVGQIEPRNHSWVLGVARFTIPAGTTITIKKFNYDAVKKITEFRVSFGGEMDPLLAAALHGPQTGSFPMNIDEFTSLEFE